MTLHRNLTEVRATYPHSSAMKRKYERAASRPWESLPPDPELDYKTFYNDPVELSLGH